jgi:hypothetical protein
MCALRRVQGLIKLWGNPHQPQEEAPIDVVQGSAKMLLALSVRSVTHIAMSTVHQYIYIDIHK